LRDIFEIMKTVCFSLNFAPLILPSAIKSYLNCQFGVLQSFLLHSEFFFKKKLSLPIQPSIHLSLFSPSLSLSLWIYLSIP
jgi:hypothetical protein